MPKIHINDKVAEKVVNGAVFSTKEVPVPSMNEPFVMMYRDRALAIYKVHESKANTIKPVKVLRIDLS